ncbi:MAG TPA: response regulator [Phycisphaerales bacterium]|nr:response regulator [Phycisphaerales bacterium]
MSGAPSQVVGSRSWADKRIFTTGEAAEICKVSQQTIIRCFDSGRLTGFRVPGSRFRRIPREELLRFMRENDIPIDALEGPKRRVLLVDDDAQVLEVLQEAFRRDGRFDIEVATNGYEAGLQTEAFRPHAIILDYMLPDINGNIVCERLRAREQSKDIKIIFVSGVVEQAEIDRLKSAGADDFIKKPFNIEKLLARVAELVGVAA